MENTVTTREKLMATATVEASEVPLASDTDKATDTDTATATAMDTYTDMATATAMDMDMATVAGRIISTIGVGGKNQYQWGGIQFNPST